MSRSMVKACVLGLVMSLGLAGCVTETNDPLAKNRDPEKAARAYVDAGTRYLQIGQMENAHRTLSRAYEIAPDDPAVNNALALFYTIEGEDSQIKKYYEAALKLDPNFSQARNNYAAYLFEKGEYDKAIKHLELVTKDYRYARRFTAFENLGICYLRVQDREAAESAFNRALQLNPNLPVSLMEMTELSMQDGDNQMAARYLAKYEKVAKPSARQLWLGIRLQRKLGDKNKLSSYELALKNLFPGSEEYKAYKASL